MDLKKNIYLIKQIFLKLPMIAGTKNKNRKEVLESVFSFGKIALHAYISTSIVIYLICFV